jgi:hypothetical protein
MSRATDKLQAAQHRAIAIRPKVGGFPYLAEVLWQAGVRRDLWYLPSCQSLYLMDDGPVVGPRNATGNRNGRRSDVQSRCTDRSIADRPGRKEYVPGVFNGDLACGSCSV